MDDGMVTCPNCGNEVRAGVRFCSHCGRLMADTAGAASTESGDFAARLSGGSGVVLSRSESTGAGQTQGDAGGPSTDEWRSSLSRGDDPFGADNSETRAVPVTPGPAPYTQGAPTIASKPQYDSLPPPRYDGRPQQTPPPPPRYGQEFESSAYSPPRYDHLPVPMAVPYGQPMIGFQCPYCRTTIPPITLERVSQTGWIVLALLIIFCLPLFWVGLLIKEPYRVCSQCRNVLS